MPKKQKRGRGSSKKPASGAENGQSKPKTAERPLSPVSQALRARFNPDDGPTGTRGGFPHPDEVLDRPFPEGGLAAYLEAVIAADAELGEKERALHEGSSSLDSKSEKDEEDVDASGSEDEIDRHVGAVFEDPSVPAHVKIDTWADAYVPEALRATFAAMAKTDPRALRDMWAIAAAGGEFEQWQAVQERRRG
ncbi:unnamed protein product [Pedinophyceae sp. YPF-701]|nr:unnamed protein product [Pedinophyceae sp. YPF-701]